MDCGTAAGTEGPSIYLMAGEDIPRALMGQFDSSAGLTKHGAPENSFVVMTPNAFTTDRAWDESAGKLANGIRMLPVVRDHPTWWFILHLDGFKSHVMTYAAQQVFYDHRILVIKENAHSSQINQAFDRDPAKDSKRGLRRWLPVVRDCVNFIKVIDQWTLLIVVMASQLGGRSKSWINGFTRVNLNPKCRRPLQVWLDEISEALVKGGRAESVDPYGPEFLYMIKVPDFYSALSVVDRELLALLKDPFDWSFDSLQQLPVRFLASIRKGERTLSKMFKFVKSMQTAVERGVADESDTLPAVALHRVI